MNFTSFSPFLQFSGISEILKSSRGLRADESFSGGPAAAALGRALGWAARLAGGLQRSGGPLALRRARARGRTEEGRRLHRRSGRSVAGGDSARGEREKGRERRALLTGTGSTGREAREATEKSRRRSLAARFGRRRR